MKRDAVKREIQRRNKSYRVTKTFAVGAIAKNSAKVKKR